MQITSFRDVVKLWPSPDALASEIGLGIEAVRKWPQRGRIPAEWWSRVLATSKAKDAGLTAEQFAELAAREAEAAR